MMSRWVVRLEVKMAKGDRKKTHDIVPLMLRLREGLRQKLAKDAERKATSLNAEIVDRLEGSYSVEEKMKLVRSALEKQLKDVRHERAELQRSWEKLQAKWEEDKRDFNEKIGRAWAAEAIVHTLLGNNAASRDVVRTVTLLLATKPWLAQEVDSAVKAIEEKTQ
jgi:Arc-like DNA binding domain